MENRIPAAAISLILLSASIAIPVNGHSADILKDIVGTLAHKAVMPATQQDAINIFNATIPSAAIDALVLVGTRSRFHQR